MATVEAAALKGLDRTLASGTHYNSARLPLPSIAGGDGVARLDDGRLVYANAQPGQGMMAEKTLINPAAAVELPKGIDPVFAAAVPNPTLSAWLSFEHRARMQEGQHVLVLGHRELLSHTRVATFFARARLRRVAPAHGPPCRGRHTTTGRVWRVFGHGRQRFCRPRPPRA